MKEDIKLKKVEKTSNIKSFIVIEPGLVLTLKKNQLLTEDELFHYQRKFGEVSFIAKELKKSKKKMNCLYYICSNCLIKLCPNELKLNEIYSLGKLYCYQCLFKIMDIRLPNFNKRNTLRILMSSHDELQLIMNKIQHYFINKVITREGEWESY